MSPKVFQVEEEMRKQGNRHAASSAITIQECIPGSYLIEDEFKNWSANGQIACRPLFGKTTQMYDWERCGKRWEMNKQHFRIRIPVTGNARKLRSFMRRFRTIQMESSFTANADGEDIENRIFRDDPTLPEFLRSPDARYIYVHKVLIPFLQKWTDQDCVMYLKRSTPDVLEATHVMILRMANGGTEDPEDVDKRDTSGKRDERVVEAEKLVRMAHIHTLNAKFATKDSINRIKTIPGTYGTSKKGKVSKFENFEAARNLLPFLFGPRTHKSTYPRLQINLLKLETCMDELGWESFGGSIEDWGSVWSMKAQLEQMMSSSLNDVWYDEAADQNHVQTPAGSLAETINVVRLAEMVEQLGGNANEELRDVQNLLERHRTESVARTVDFSTIIVMYVRKHEIPGRRWAVGPSMQKCPKWARKVAFAEEIGASAGSGRVCLEIDQNCSGSGGGVATRYSLRSVAIFKLIVRLAG